MSADKKKKKRAGCEYNKRKYVSKKMGSGYKITGDDQN